MDKPDDNKSQWHFPPDFTALLGMAIIPVAIAMLMGILLPPLFRARRGDSTILWVAVAFAAVGIALLFIARLPLYQQRRFFTLGPGSLDERHRRIYRWAYMFIGGSAVLLVMLNLTLR